MTNGQRRTGHRRAIFLAKLALTIRQNPNGTSISACWLKTRSAQIANGGKADKGATNAKERVALIADSRSDSTMAHEAGHFLGALTAEGKYDSEYGHPEKSQEMLMHVDHIGKKIPYAAVLKFNYGYHS
jgi:hypothetical protein